MHIWHMPYKQVDIFPYDIFLWYGSLRKKSVNSFLFKYLIQYCGSCDGADDGAGEDGNAY